MNQQTKLEAFQINKIDPENRMVIIDNYSQEFEVKEITNKKETLIERKKRYNTARNLARKLKSNKVKTLSSFLTIII